MIANYGFEDGSGTYYISIDDQKCSECQGRECIASCPGQVFGVELNDWDDEVVTVKEEHRRQLSSVCAECKRSGAGIPPCISACEAGAISHTW